jgi:hypothetical protein
MITPPFNVPQPLLRPFAVADAWLRLDRFF